MKTITAELTAAPPHSEARHETANIAAFFDLDGTLLPLPSLERRLFRQLRYRRLIGPANYLRWLFAAVRLAPRGIGQVLYANKMYLRGVSVHEVATGTSDEKTRPQHRLGGVYQNDLSCFPQALARVAWHATRGHAILIVSGTLQPIALSMGAALEDHLSTLGIRTTIGVYATRLETRGPIFTGRIAGDAMFGEAKTRAVKQIAASRRFDLEKCFAYGDSANDRWMLESVGRPHAVNPSGDLTRIAARNNWPILRWTRSDGASQKVRQNPSRSDATRSPHLNARRTAQLR